MYFNYVNTIIAQTNNSELPDTFVLSQESSKKPYEHVADRPPVPFAPLLSFSALLVSGWGTNHGFYKSRDIEVDPFPSV
jgi:hypothetical protein